MSVELLRYAWTWDHSTNWTPGVHGRQTTGTNRPYLKRAEVFLSDYERLIDFLARKGFSGLCVWGLVRESHGGAEAARQIVRYGRERGVSVTPGVGLFTYGGAFYEGRHEYNLETFALARPECTAVVDQGGLETLALGRTGKNARPASLEDAFLRGTRPWVQLCPSNPDVISWMKEAVSWAIETLDLQTVMLEGGDVFACQCDPCRRRRTRDVAERFSLEDLCAGYMPAVEHVHRHHPGVEVQCETYAAPGLAPALSPTSFGGFIPRDCLASVEGIPRPAQLQLFYLDSMPEEQMNLPAGIAERSLLRTEMGSQWRGPKWPHCAARGIAMQCRVCRKLGIPAISLFTETPDSTPSHWLNYEAVATFSREDIPFEKFVERDIAPHLGGVDQAMGFIQWSADPRCADTTEGLEFARQGAAAATDEQEFLKWAWLARFIDEFGRTPWRSENGLLADFHG